VEAAGRGDGAAYNRIVSEWNSDWHTVDGDSDYAEVMRGRELFGEPFGELAKAVFDPLRKAEAAS
jgi:hypothetical protein